MSGFSAADAVPNFIDCIFVKDTRKATDDQQSSTLDAHKAMLGESLANFSQTDF